jgi:hypothetical protein
LAASGCGNIADGEDRPLRTSSNPGGSRPLRDSEALDPKVQPEPGQLSQRASRYGVTMIAVTEELQDQLARSTCSDHLLKEGAAVGQIIDQFCQARSKMLSIDLKPTAMPPPCAPVFTG